MSLNLNIYQTLAAAIVVYYIGVLLRVKISVLRKYCIPSPVVGGILFAIVNCILYTQGIWKYEQDTIMQNICMMLFFTSVGYTASISLIKRGGIMVLKMAIVTTILIICQNIIGSGLAMAFNLSPLLGLATGSIPMVGGHGTAAAFGPPGKHRPRRRRDHCRRSSYVRPRRRRCHRRPDWRRTGPQIPPRQLGRIGTLRPVLQCRHRFDAQSRRRQ